MKTEALITTVKELLADNKGLLAMDESVDTCNKRFAEYNIAQTAEMRKKYRELIVTTEGLNESISGAILFDETIRQQRADGTPFIKILADKGIIPGIKVDMGAKPLAGFAGEKVTEGLDGLRERLLEYSKLGARFAKWRAVFTIANGLPTAGCKSANAHALARYAALCQEVGLVPMVEPEVLMDGNHSLAECAKVTEQVLHTVFEQLYKQKVLLKGMILKPNMVLSGFDSAAQASIEEVAENTINSFLKTVPAAVSGIAFLSGGQSAELATDHLNRMNKIYKSAIPWSLTFSFGRALQQPALAAWLGKDENIQVAQEALKFRAKCNRLACMGKYNDEVENKV